MKLILTALAACLLLSNSALAQTSQMRQQLAAMEVTLFGKAYCKDTPIRRLERLEENWVEPSKQKHKDLQTRIDELLAKVKPSEEALQQPDPCAVATEKKPSKSLFRGIMERPVEGAWTERNYPFIKWHGKQMESLDNSVAQLKTDYADLRSGKMKYILTIKLPDKTFPRSFVVTFLDEHGFKLNKFVVDGSQFQATEGQDNTRLWEAKEQTFFPEKDYKQARDYTVTPVM